MTRRFWISLLVTVLTLAGCIYVSFLPQTILPVDLNPSDSDHVVVAPSSFGIPMPPNLQAGDVVRPSAMDWHDRVIFNSTTGNPSPGTPVTLAVERAGQPMKVAVAYTPVPLKGEFLGILVLGLILNWLFAALGLLLLWRAQRLAAAAVCFWCLLNVFYNITGSTNLPLVANAVVGTVGAYLLNVGSLLALYFLADDLTGAGLSPRVRRGMRYVFIAVLLLYAVANPCSRYLALTLTTLPDWVVQAARGTHLLAFAVPLTLLSLFYRRAPAEERPRIRWVWLSILVYIAAYIAQINVLPLSALQNNVLNTLLTALAFLGLTYAVLRHRLVSLQLVLNRTLVYGVITTLVVGVFAALSSFISHFAIGKTEGALMQLLVPLLLGVTLQVVKRRLDGWVERLFFQKQYQAEAALARFARDCAFIENREVLLDRSVAELAQQLKPTGVAIYEKAARGYLLARQSGNREFPKTLDNDDPAPVSLRADLAEADLDRMQSALGRDGLAFPLAVRGVLGGLMVLGQRPAEHYAQSERALLARISQQLAASLYALRAREAEAFVDAVARGELQGERKILTRARKLQAA